MRAAHTGIPPNQKMSSTSKPSYSGVVVRHGASILLCKRQPNGPIGGYWSVPCGAVEKGEAPFVAAQRELEEETQIKINTSELQYVTAFKGHDGGRFNLYLHNASEFLSPVLDYEHTEWGYFRLDKVETLYINQSLMDALVFLRDKFLTL